ncbi:enoyl-CoA hydratase [Janibacter melonis]|uniref:Enoyl-CoA hydratase n=1 Tax=Janibacter melonis TaxID=262209 RepID=A0A176QGW0_9MICO|nr:crotonase/enoyl-CoA hydratase family protein [Janibacter melonis]MBD5830580.1 crotonase/enoyl-CoA hydratase family protein [Janibacter melonis]OAB88920.1 enoyl-CoA hydratase [Janibacter melonis]
MATSYIRTTRDGGVATVELHRPDKLNALTLDMLDGLVSTAHELGRDRSLRAVIIAGSGESFCAGLDFATVMSDRAGLWRAFAPRPWRGTNTFQEACWAYRRLPVPVVAAVHGNCLGGGLQIALGADFRVTTPDARWSVLEGRWGLIPDMSGIQALSEQVGKDVAKRLTMTAEVLDGERAVELGLASEVALDPRERAGALVDELLTRSPDALASAKRLFEGTWHRGPRHTFARERVEQLGLLVAANTRRARSAAFARTTPEYADRGRRLLP